MCQHGILYMELNVKQGNDLYETRGGLYKNRNLVSFFWFSDNTGWEQPVLLIDFFFFFKIAYLVHGQYWTTVKLTLCLHHFSFVEDIQMFPNLFRTLYKHKLSISTKTKEVSRNNLIKFSYENARVSIQLRVLMGVCMSEIWGSLYCLWGKD